MSTNRKYIKIPMFNVGGWYDIFNHGNISQLRVPAEPGRQGRARQPEADDGRRSATASFPATWPIPAATGWRCGGDQEIRWFDYWLKGVDNGIMDEPPVSYFMMGPARKGAYSPKNRHADLRQLAAGQPRGALLPDPRQGAWSTKAPAAADVKVSYRFDPGQSRCRPSAAPT